MFFEFFLQIPFSRIGRVIGQNSQKVQFVMALFGTQTDFCSKIPATGSSIYKV